MKYNTIGKIDGTDDKRNANLKQTGKGQTKFGGGHFN